MKKYLISGMAALMFCGVFTSCTRDTDLGGGQGQQQKVMETYEQAFLTRFGQPSPNQDWGFGSSRANTRTENKNLNEWGDPTKGNWVVPDALSPDQKTRVMAYFQANPGLTYEDPHLTNFFIQQVYKGGTTPGAISSEQYTQTNGTPLIGSDNMDWLYMGTGLDHVNDYNDGTWNGGVEYEVLNTGANANAHQGNTTHVDGVTHPDMITLMENSSTEFVAFGSSTGNQYHTDCCALAGWRVIEAWAIAHEDSLKAIGKFGATLDDGWDRSFVGLDYENRTIDNLYSTWKGNAKAKDFMDGNSHWVLYNGTVVNANNFADFDLKDVYGNNVLYVRDDVSNQAIADYIKYTKSDNTVGNVTKDAYNYKLTKQQFKDLYGVDITNGEDGLYNLDMIMGYIRQSALPTENNGNWVKNIGGRDYVFSDWIVTLTEAKKQGDTPNPVTEIEKLRVIAEDLSVGENTDFDFNDVVFDVIWTKTYSDETKTNLTSQKVEIKLLAAGGTLPLYVDGKEVHDLFGVDQSTMVNTNAKARGLKGKDDAQPVTWETSNYSGTTIGEIANSIVVKVVKNGEEYLIRAERGHIASKIGVKFINEQEYQWCDERQDIDDKYSLIDGTSLFTNWVQGIYPSEDWYTYAYDEIMKYRNRLNGAQGN